MTIHFGDNSTLTQFSTVAASKLTGALPAISGASLTTVGRDVRSMNEATSTGESTNHTNTDTDKVTLSINTASNSRVIVFYGFEIKHSNTSNVACVATVRGTNTSFVGGEIIETHDDTNYEKNQGQALDISSHSGTRTYRIQFRRSASNGYARIRNAYLCVVEFTV